MKHIYSVENAVIMLSARSAAEHHLTSCPWLSPQAMKLNIRCILGERYDHGQGNLAFGQGSKCRNRRRPLREQDCPSGTPE